jgi:phenylpropionate dioxygenase-like ring-hydroxylating dioxygenase large terminal subunit
MAISAEQNERLTRVGAGTPMGELMRRYWIPACLSEELPYEDAPPVRVRLLGEDLVAFRDTNGTVGIVDAFCPHRGAPLFFGRNEECGLRCVYHGWKFDTSGRCVDMPTESRDTLRERVNVPSYPAWEAAGVVWTYMGPPELQPEKPDYEWLRATVAFNRVSKTGEACNFLQALEGGLDTAHASYAHNNDISAATLVTADGRPKLDVDRTDYGYRYAGIRTLTDGTQYVRVNLFIMPFMQLRTQPVEASEGRPASTYLSGHLWVPIDDENTYVYNFLYCGDSNRTVEDDEWVEYEKWFGRGPDDYIPGTYWLKANASNDYLIDRDVQRTKTYTGIEGVNTQDFALQEGMGAIVDRTKEHLGTSDHAILTERRIYFEAMDAVEAGEQPIAVDPSSIAHVRAAESLLAPGLDWRVAMDDDFTTIW